MTTRLAFVGLVFIAWASATFAFAAPADMPQMSDASPDAGMAMDCCPHMAADERCPQRPLAASASVDIGALLCRTICAAAMPAPTLGLPWPPPEPGPISISVLAGCGLSTRPPIGRLVAPPELPPGKPIYLRTERIRC